MNQVKACRYGLMIYQPNDAYIGRSLDLYGEYSESEVALFRAVLQPGQTALDVGAKIGAHTLALARLVGPTGRVLAFEPQRSAYYSLCGNVAQNNLDQVACHQAVVGAAAGKINVPLLDSRHEQNFGALDLSQDFSSAATHSAPVVRIDDLGLSACHFIKLDVEGMERQALEGAVETIRRFRPLLYVEDDQAAKSHALHELLDSLGYEMYSHRAPLYNVDNFARNPENVFGSIVSLSLYCRHRSVAAAIDPRQFGMQPVAPPAAELAQMTIDAKSLPQAIDESRRLHQAGRVSHAEQLYRRILEFDAEQPQVWYLLGAACQALGMPDDAIEAFGQSVARRPQHAESHNHLGVVLAQQQRLEEAISHFRQAAALKPGDSEILSNLGLAWLQSQQPAEAETQFRAVLHTRPNDLKARRNLEQALRAQGKLEELLEVQRQLSAGQPASAEARSELGRVLFEQRKLDEAEAAFQAALEINPALPEAHNNLGLARVALGKPAEAAPCYREAIRLRPDFAQAHNNLGIALRQSGKLDEAVAACREAVRISPHMAEAHNNLGTALDEQGRTDEAIACLEQALRIKPDFAKAFNNLGIAYWHRADYAQAAANCRKAIELSPELAEAHNNLGNVLRDQGDYAGALACYERSLKLSPDGVDAHWNRSLVWLLEGNFAQGWPEYDWRWKLKSFSTRATNRPFWDGSLLAGRTILLDAEQGLGDTLQFIRYAPLVQQRGGRVIAVCQKPLVQILSSCPGIDRLVAQGEPVPDFDVYAPLLSLPKIFGTTLETVPAEIPYLHADRYLVEQWGRELAPIKAFKVGIAWKGSPKNRMDQQRSIPLAAFEPLARVPGVQLISLQKGPGSEQLQETASRFAVIDLAQRLDEKAGAFMDTAAVIEHLDLVVTCDSSLGHLAGALGAPTWIALALSPDWRWLLERDDSPWYPTVRLFRKTSIGDWNDVFRRMAAALEAAVAASKSRG
ncbi:MAG TPA: FkbM family methyltransferase [Pirellulales bacterium]|nr:FkbM family methyltransferase [Pirellulales bacterium]